MRKPCPLKPASGHSHGAGISTKGSDLKVLKERPPRGGLSRDRVAVESTLRFGLLAATSQQPNHTKSARKKRQGGRKGRCSVDAREINRLGGRLQREVSGIARVETRPEEHRSIAVVDKEERADWPAVTTTAVIAGSWCSARGGRAARPWVAARARRIPGTDAISFEAESVISGQADVEDLLGRIIHDPIKDVIIAGIIGYARTGSETCLERTARTIRDSEGPKGTVACANIRKSCRGTRACRKTKRRYANGKRRETARF